MIRKKYILLLVIFLLPVISNCGRHYIRHHAGVGVRVTKHYPERDYDRDYYNDNDYYDNYDAGYTQSSVDIEFYPRFYIGTSLHIGNYHLHWCDFCQCWHPRCTWNVCYCHPTVVRYYRFYRLGHYVNHCYHWHHDRHYRPRISTYRWKGNGYNISYNINEHRRKFGARKNGYKDTKRIRYRGKEEIAYNYNGENKRITNRRIKTVPERKQTINNTGNRTVTKKNTQARMKSENTSVQNRNTVRTKNENTKSRIKKREENLKKNSTGTKRNETKREVNSTRKSTTNRAVTSKPKSTVSRIKDYSEKIRSTVNRAKKSSEKVRKSVSSSKRSSSKSSSYTGRSKSKSSSKSSTRTKRNSSSRSTKRKK